MRDGDAALSTRRLAAWARASAAGDAALFDRRLERDGWSIAQVKDRLGAVCRNAGAAPAWLENAIWIEAVLQNEADPAEPFARPEGAEACAFEPSLVPIVEQAQKLVWAGLNPDAIANFSAAARTSLGWTLLETLSGLCAAALYERFAQARSARPHPEPGCYERFVAGMKAGGFSQLFEDKPVLLRLIATLTRQWIDTTREFVLRLSADLPAIRRDILCAARPSRAVKIESDLSDPHNDGRSVFIVGFEDGTRVVYKPKDLRLDAAWQALVTRLNHADAPIDLRAIRVLVREGYGWTEFVDHTGCADGEGCDRFFRRAGAWLALLHCFAATDMHQENMIATSEHPVPVDLETILQPSADEHKVHDPDGEAFDAALDIIGNSVMTVGLLPAYGRSIDNHVFAMGGMTADWTLRSVIKWHDINADGMRPAKAKEQSPVTPNLPHVGGRYAKFTEHIESFVAGFADYARFLQAWTRMATSEALFEGFAGLPVRKVIRPTRFYYMLLQRLKDHRIMDDGAAWSAQADFVTRLSEWDKDSDPLWPLYRAERSALLGLNVPHFVTPSDGDEVRDATGVTVRTAATPGLQRAIARLRNLDDREIAWQVEVIRENTRPAMIPAASIAPAGPKPSPQDGTPAVPTSHTFITEADRIAAELAQLAIRRGPGAAWIGLDWLGDAEVFQLVCLGPDLYNGATGIALFLAAHAAVTGSKASGELALAGLAHIRKSLKSRNAPRMARALGTGGAVGLGSIVYAFAVMAQCLDDDALRADAHGAARLFTDELIVADRRLDIIGGSAGAILALLRLYRDSGSDDVLARAVKCGEHLLRQDRVGAEGRHSWVGQGSGAHGLNGMSHGAAGFGYALAALAEASGRDEFAQAAAECLAFENASYDAVRGNWPDLRGAEPLWPCQWCHGAAGIGLARVGAFRRGVHATSSPLWDDIRRAAEGVQRGTPLQVDTLCCGTLGNVEFLCEAAATLDRADLRALAAQRLGSILGGAAAKGDYRWNSGKRQFNLGLFRGLSGVGYTLLRQISSQRAAARSTAHALPNVLIWE